MSEETDVSAQNLSLEETDKPAENDKPADELVKSSSVEPFDWNNLKSDTSFSEAARKRVLSLAASNNRSTYRKVEEAIAVIGTGDNGASVPAIVTWILNNYSTLDPSKLKVNVKRAILKGLKGGTLVRAKTSKKAMGVSGSFTFPAQRIKLKAVRLEGKKYVFPILQPVSSASNAGDEKPQVSEPVIKRRLSLDASIVKSSPKRVAKKRSKRVISEISDKTEVQE
ncbi:hypothetical protein JTE90_002946 [Oedothorax gibbosus]|uniref:H15 domain-containing protein n=1 Tax=Oedothorax gibbosus TaxID=931172 RepID=A0AAV6UJC3_9ARAC|nr:hypothetical protein JTE90_002946 [Oedothorax gibbosus]